MYVELPVPPISARIRRMKYGQLRLTLEYPDDGVTPSLVRDALARIIGTRQLNGPAEPGGTGDE